MIKSMVSRGRLVAALIITGFALAGCGTSSNISSSTTVITPATTQSQFGVNFAAAFNAMANSEPAAVNDGDIISISLTAEPIAI